MLNLSLVFCHFLAASLALGAIVATDLRLLSKLAQDRVRIAPPNAFVTRIVGLSLAVLYVTGAAIVWQGAAERADYLDNPKLQAKIILVALLTLNAFVLHRFTFPRLARGRRVARWRLLDWVAIAVPVGASNALWLFVAFLGVARAWNDTLPLAAVFAAGAIVYLAVQTGICAILVIAARPIDPAQRRWSDVVRRALASVGDLGAPPRPAAGTAPRRRHDDPVDEALETGSALTDTGRSTPGTLRSNAPPALRLVASERRGREARQR
ncbi:MAG: hypothetical protein ABIQ33_02625 [Caldimonas sp.]